MIVLISAMAASLPAYPAELLLGTREVGTFSNFAGQTLCRVLSGQPGGLACRTVPSQDAVNSLTNLSGGSLDLCLIDSEVLLEAVSRTGRFEFLGMAYDNLRFLLPVYPVPISLVVRQDAGIANLQDILGKRINAGLPGSQQNRVFRRVMSAQGWSREDFALFEELPSGSSEESMAFCHETIQALIHVGIHPDPWLASLFGRCPAGLVGLEGREGAPVMEASPAYGAVEARIDRYPGHGGRMRTVGTTVVLAASEDLEPQTVSVILESLQADQEGLRSVHPALSGFRVRAADPGDGRFRLHSGAQEYFRGRGSD